MKILGIILMLITTPLFAMNGHVGESVNYTIANTEQTALLNYEVLSHDDVSGNYQVETELISNGTSHTTVKDLHQDEIMTHEKADHVLAVCVENGGILTDLTVVGEIFQTCKISISSMLLESLVPSFSYEILMNNEGYAWVGDFPIWGIGKVDVILGTSMEINQMHWNN